MVLWGYQRYQRELAVQADVAMVEVNAKMDGLARSVEARLDAQALAIEKVLQAVNELRVTA